MMNRFQNVRHVNSPPHNLSEYNSALSKSVTSQEGVRLNFNSINSSKTMIEEVDLSKSSFINKNNVLYESSVKNSMRGLGSLPEERIKSIAQIFVQNYGNGSQLTQNHISRVQKLAYDKISGKAEFGDEERKELKVVMDVNGDNRISVEDITCLCRRYLNCEKRPIAYTPLVEERLAVARRLFKQFDTDKKGYLTEKQVPHLLSQTYKTLGKTFQATEQDVKSWMKLADGDGDGHVSLPEYERSIIRALKKQGIKIYEQ